MGASTGAGASVAFLNGSFYQCGSFYRCGGFWGLCRFSNGSFYQSGSFCRFCRFGSRFCGFCFLVAFCEMGAAAVAAAGWELRSRAFYCRDGWRAAAVGAVAMELFALMFVDGML